MPEKYHIETKPVLPRLPRIGKFGVVDWQEDCARCHNCVKKACIYDRYREESDFIRNMKDVDSLFFECMGCYSCMQDCTKSILRVTVNSEYKKLGNTYWNPAILRTTWLQAETGKVPVSGAGYRGKFSGSGFDSMWTDMSEIVRPTRDGIHGREYISTSVDLGKKLSRLEFDGENLINDAPPLISLPFPAILDMLPESHSYPEINSYVIETAKKTGLIAMIDSTKAESLKEHLEKNCENFAFYFKSDNISISEDLIKKNRYVEISSRTNVTEMTNKLKKINPQIVISVRVDLHDGWEEEFERVVALDEVEVIRIQADSNGNEKKAENPKFIKDIIREIHTNLIKRGKRDQITLITGGGIALPEHLAKVLLCGADLVAIDLPLLIALECRLCDGCNPDDVCPSKIDNLDKDYAVGRMTNLMGAWHWQLVEVMGAMGIREARRLRGDVGRAMFNDELDKEIFGEIFSN